MAQTTSVYGFPYLELGDAPDIAGITQDLAEAVEATLRGDLVLGGDLTVPGALNAPGFGFTTFSPAVYASAGTTPSPIARTVNHARYWRLGNLVLAQADVTLGANTSGGCAIDLPVPSSVRLLNCGTCALMGSGTLPSDQSGVAYMLPSLDKLVIVAYSQGFRDGQSGQILRYSVMYPAA